MSSMIHLYLSIFIFETSGYDHVRYTELHNQIVALYIFLYLSYITSFLSPTFIFVEPEPLWSPEASFEERQMILKGNILATNLSNG